MIAVLRNPTYARLFTAQVVALLGTGLLTVALGLLAYDIAGGNAGIVMGVAMTIKMVAYVAAGPVLIALTARVPRKTLLITADVARAAVAISLPFVTEAWQIYLLIFLLQSASATFTPAFQAVIPSVLPDEDDYTEALSLSRLAYDLEALLSPMLAAALLTVVAYSDLFAGTAVGFLISAALVLSAVFPSIEAPTAAPFFERLTRGVRVFWTSRELRGLVGLNLAVATSTAMVIVNTVVLVQGELGRSERDVTLMLTAYGLGSMVVALSMPRLLTRITDRMVMILGGSAIPLLLLVSSAVIYWVSNGAQWLALLLLWLLLGAAASLILTPSARLLRRGSDENSRPAVFAAQFSLSHACFLFTYPLAGVIGAAIGLAGIALIFAILGVLGTAFAVVSWRNSAVRSASADH